MPSTGNDIIDLSAVQPERCTREAFYTKVLSPAELSRYREQHAQAISFVAYLWLCWSVKESVFKFLQRHQPLLRFSPTRTETDLLRQDAACLWSGSATCGGSRLLFRTVVDPDYIHTIVSDTDDFSGTLVAIGKADPERLSASVRSLLLDRLASTAPGIDFSITATEEGVPMLLENGSSSGTVISFSHHGRWAAAVAKSVRVSSAG